MAPFPDGAAASEARVLADTSRRWRALGDSIFWGTDLATFDLLDACGFTGEFGDYDAECALLGSLVGHRPSRRRAARTIAQYGHRGVKARRGFHPNGMDLGAVRAMTRCFEVSDALALYGWLCIRRFHPHTKKSSSLSTREG